MSVLAMDTTSTMSQIPYQSYQQIYPSLTQTQVLPPMMSDTNTKECLIVRILKSSSFKVILAIIAIVIVTIYLIKMIFKYKVMKSLESLKSLYNVQSFRLVDKKEDEKKK